MISRKKKKLLRALAIVALLALAGWAWSRYLTRDPEARFRARRGAVATVVAGTPRADGASQRRDVRVVSTSGLAVDMAIRRPLSTDETQTSRRPLLVLLGGHVTGREAIELVRETRGNVVAALSYPFEGSAKIKGWRVVAAAPRIRRALFDTPPAVMLALDYLIEQPYVDPARVEIVGVSLGAPFACIAGALDTRFTRVWSIHGAGDLRRLLDHNLERKIGFRPARALVSRLAYVAIGGDALAPEHWVARVAPREIVFVNAESDERLPRACVEVLHAAAREPREILWRPGLHVEPKRADIVQELVDIVLARER